MTIPEETKCHCSCSSDGGLKKITIRVSRGMWADLKHKSVEEERSMQVIIVDSVTAYLRRGLID